MAKKMKKLEKECQSWKSRFDGCNKSLIDMVADVRNVFLFFSAQYNSLIVRHVFIVFHTSQKAIKEKEFELVTVKNQKLENLCRALQEERKNLYEKVQGAGGQPDDNMSKPTEKESAEVVETPKEPQEDQTTAAPAAPASSAAPAAPAASAAPAAPAAPAAAAPTLESPLTKELAKLKSEQARLKEIASSFTISHIIPTETGDSQSQELSEGVQEPKENHIEESNGEQLREVEKDEFQEQRDLEMESVD